jgi:NitT/TauT family transport system substrate-binding protein
VDDAQFAALLQEQWLYSGATPLCYRLGEHGVRALVSRPTKMKMAGGVMRLTQVAGIAFAIAISGATIANAAEIRLAEQFSMGYLQFNIMKRDRLIEKYATQRGLKDFKVSWQRFNGPVAMNEALLSNSTDIVSGGVPGLITLWDKTQGTSFEVKGICALSSQPFLLNTANPDIKSIKDFGERDRIGVPSIKVSVQAVVLQMAAAVAFGEENYAKLDPLTVSMSPPDATIAMLSGAGGVNSAFSVPPFQFQQLEQKNIHTVDLGTLPQGQSRALWRVSRCRKGSDRDHCGRPKGHRAKLDRRYRFQAAAGNGDQGRDGQERRMDHDTGRDDEVRQIHAQGRHHQARTGVVERHVLSGDRRAQRELMRYATPRRSECRPPARWRRRARSGTPPAGTACPCSANG